MRPLTILLAATLTAVFLGGCASTPPEPDWDDPSTPPDTVWDSNGETVPRPEWIGSRNPVGGDGVMYFVGISPGSVDEATANERAIAAAKDQIADYIGESYVEEASRTEEVDGLRSAGIDHREIEEALRTTTQSVLLSRQVATENYYELRRGPSGDLWYAWVRTVWDEGSQNALNDAIEETLSRLRQESLERAAEQSQLVERYFDSINAGVSDIRLDDLRDD